MAPRKRPRPNPAEASSSSLPADIPAQQSSVLQGALTTESSAATEPIMSSPSRRRGKDAPASLPNLSRQVHKTRSWYGSWPRVPKSSASTQLATENILGGTLKPTKAPDFARFESKKDTSEDTPETQEQPGGDPTQAPTPADDGKMDVDETPETSNGGTSNENEQDSSEATNKKTDAPDLAPEATPERPSTSSGWLGWFGRSPAPNDVSQPQEQMQETDNKNPADAKEEETPKVQAPEAPQQPDEPEPTGVAPVEAVPKPRSTSWFGIWSNANDAASQKQPEEQISSAEPTKAREPEDAIMEDAPQPNPPTTDPVPTTEPIHPPPAGSTWAFWSRDTRDTRPKSGGNIAPHPEDGELAVAGQESETHPQHATSEDVQESPKDKKKNSKQKEGGSAPKPIAKTNKRLRPQSIDINTPTASPPQSSSLKSDKGFLPSKQDGSLAKGESSKADSSAKATPAKDAAGKATPAKDVSNKTLSPNLLLPSFKSTYRMKENPSILQQIAEFLLRTKQPPANHVFRAKETTKIRNAISIGVHGLFPARYITPIIGAPTGTSLRFASLGAEAIRRWADENGCSDCEIEKISLEGEGKIGDRVENLWKLLLNWIDHIRKADLIILSCHSQGVPVSIILLAKMLDMGIISDAKIGVCAMAGVSLGPFPDYKSGMGMFMGSAAELWEFANPQSEISQRYENALKEVLEYGARITFIGSIDDQLVPMESAVHSPAIHPYIYRAVFIDGRIHAPDFIAHLVGFALKLRNLGVSDHGLVRELSIPLAGSLYSGEGHSRLYYDDQVYDLAISHALETTSVPKHPCHIQRHESLAATNPYTLPWVMRGLLEEDFVKTELSSEAEELLRQFDAWKPTTKALKDVKYRLEAVRSKL